MTSSYLHMYYDRDTEEWFATFSRAALDFRFPRLRGKGLKDTDVSLLEYPTHCINVIREEGKEWWVAADWLGCRPPSCAMERLLQEGWKRPWRVRPHNMIVALTPSLLHLKCRVRRTFPLPHRIDTFEYRPLRWVEGPLMTNDLVTCYDCDGKGEKWYGMTDGTEVVYKDACHTCLGLKQIEPTQEEEEELRDEEWQKGIDLLNEM